MTARGFRSSEQGMTLIETIVAMLIFFIALTALIPLFMTYRLATVQNEIKLGAVAVSQRVMDEVRQVDVASLPNSGSRSLPGSSLYTGGTSITSLPYAGKNYSATVTYCQTTTYCDANSRQVQVQVSYGGRSIYQIETIYTRLE
jgi:type II secretory pathway pseudopilin PulG